MPLLSTKVKIHSIQSITIRVYETKKMKAKDTLYMNHEYNMQNALSGQLPTDHTQ